MTQSSKDLLLNSVKNADPESLQSIINEDIINHIFTVYEDKQELNAFQILCTEIITKKEKDEYDSIEDKYRACAKILLENKISLTYKDPDFKGQAIDFAALTGDVVILKETRSYYKEANISIANIDLITTVLNYYEGEQILESDYLEVIKELLEDVYVNTQDYNTGETPIHLAARLKFRDVIELLCSHKKEYIDYDFYKDANNISARDLIMKCKLYSGELPDIYSNRYQLVRRYLYEGKLKEYIESFQKLSPDIGIVDQVSLLFRAVHCGNLEITEYMLKEIKNSVEYVETLLRISCNRGYYKIVELLLKETEIKVTIQLVKDIVIKKVEVDEKRSIDNNKCLQLILNLRRVNINETDKFEKIVLQYALKYQNYSMVKSILDSGGSLILSNPAEDCMVLDIEPQLLLKHFDSCITTYEKIYELRKKLKRSNENKREYDFTINFTSILPPKTVSHNLSASLLHIGNSSNSETTRLNVEASVQIDFQELQTEMVVLKRISKDLKYLELLRHPLIMIFLALKWRQIRFYFYMDFYLFVFYLFSLLILILSKTNEIFWLQPIGYLFVLVTLICEIGWEIIKTLILRENYFKVIGSWLKCFLFCIIITILLFYCTSTPRQVNSIERQLFAVASLISILIFFNSFGHLPQHAINVFMIRTVYWTLIRFALTYSILIIAFATSFYVLFQENFTNPGLALFKTLMMLVGEYNSTDLPLASYPLVSYGIIVLFVFLISIGMLNLLTGLAVSDIQRIKIEAELFDQVTRVRQVSRMEKMLLKNKFIQSILSLREIYLFPSNIVKSVQVESSKRTIHIIDKDGNPSISIKLDPKIFNALDAKKYEYTKKYYSTEL